MSRRSILPVIVAGVLTAQAAARADEGSPEPSREDPDARSIWSDRRTEWVGLELTLATVNAGSPSVDNNRVYPGTPSPRRLQLGPGGIVRLFRQRWPRLYWTPLQAGLFVSLVSNDLETIFAHVETEGGARFPFAGGSQSLEVGLAAGAGIVSIPFVTGCDGSCAVGGAGALLSPVLRYLFKEGPGLTIGFTLRAAIPLHRPKPESHWFGPYTDPGMLFIGGLDLAFGS